MKRRLFQGIMVLGFLAMLFVPLIMSDFAGGGISETEKRQLAAFPDVLDSNGRLSPGFKKGFESWLQDNIGFRSDFVDLTAFVQYKLFRQPTTPRVEIGRDGWLFITDTNDISSSTGDFRLPEERLEEIALRQQHLDDYYTAQGIQYLYVITAMKTAIYPEFMASGDGELHETPINLTEDYLKEHTSIEVLNTKQKLIECKPKGILYYKTDTHWNQLGAYCGYQAVADQLTRMGFRMKEFPVSFSTKKNIGDLTKMLNAVHILGEETAPLAQWESSATELTEGEIYDAIRNDPKNLAMRNPDAPNGTLLIYGDSFWSRGLNLPQLLSESFQTVVYVDFRENQGHMINGRLEALIHPDVVIFSNEERELHMYELLSQIPWPVKTLPGFAWRERTPEEAARAGLRVQIEKINDENPSTQEAVVVPNGAQTLILEGWAADMAAGERLADLYVQAGERLFRCDYRIARHGAAGDNPALEKTGFMTAIPVETLRDAQAAELSFIAVNADGQSMSVAATYPLVWDTSGE